MEELLSFESAIALLSLTAMEIVLGIDNIVFIAVLTGKLEPSQQPMARRLGLGLAMITRILLLLGISWVMQLTEPLTQFWGRAYSARDVILLAGGLFLIAKSTHEIHDKLDYKTDEPERRRAAASVRSAVAQIMILDVVFSLDSVITAIGMAQHVAIMVAAIVLAVGVMLVFATPVSNFVQRHPTTKMLALSFLILIGVMLVAEGLGKHIGKGYVYFAMCFSLLVEMLNLRARKVRRRALS